MVRPPVARRAATRTTVHLPSLGALARNAGRPLLESTLVPLALFWVLFEQVGLDAGMIAALAWTLVALGSRAALRRPVPAVLILSTVLLLVRTGVGWWSGSALLYFLQPTVQNFALAALLLATVTLDRPLLARLADDFCAFPDALTGHPQIRRFFRHVSVLWAGVFLANGAVTLAVLASRTVGDYLVVSTAGSYALVGLGIVASLYWFRRSLAGEGIRLRLAGPGAVPG